MGLPDEVDDMDEVKVEMTTVLRRILLRLADRISGLKVSNIEEKMLLDGNNDNNRQRQRRRRHMQQQQKQQHHHHRSLLKDITIYYNVYVIKDESKKFGPLIINEIRDSFGEVLEQIQQFADTKYFGSNLNLNWCTTKNGKYDLCVVSPKNEGGSSPTSSSTLGRDTPFGTGYDIYDTNVSSMAPWAIAFIVIIILTILCCTGYWIGVVYFGITNCFKYVDDDALTVYQDEQRSGSRTMYSEEQLGYKSRTRYHPQLMNDTNGTSNTNRRSQVSNVKRIKAAPPRDPTMYIPGMEDRPDPLAITDGGRRSSRRHQGGGGSRSSRSSQSGASNSSRRRYYEEEDNNNNKTKKKKSQRRPKRDPTMYVDGEATYDNNDNDGDKSNGSFSIIPDHQNGGDIIGGPGGSRRSQQQQQQQQRSYYSNDDDDKPAPQDDYFDDHHDNNNIRVDVDVDEYDYLASYNRTKDYDMPPRREGTGGGGGRPQIYVDDDISQPSFLTEPESYVSSSSKKKKTKKKTREYYG